MRARRDHRPESDYDVLCLIPDDLTVDFDIVEDGIVEAVAAFGGLANVQFVPESRLEDLYFEFAYLPSACTVRTALIKDSKVLTTVPHGATKPCRGGFRRSSKDSK